MKRLEVKKGLKRVLWGLLVILIIGFALPQDIQMPVVGADAGDFNKKSFWFFPWGKSGTHKGVDIFAKKGTPIKAATGGWVLRAGENELGGKVLVILGPKWRIHYYAHLDDISVSRFQWVNHETLIGTVGDSGNAKGKAPHLHYSIATLIPYPWLIDKSPQGWKKMFYLDPIPHLKD